MVQVYWPDPFEEKDIPKYAKEAVELANESKGIVHIRVRDGHILKIRPGAKTEMVERRLMRGDTDDLPTYTSPIPVIDIPYEEPED